MKNICLCFKGYTYKKMLLRLVTHKATLEIRLRPKYGPCHNKYIRNIIIIFYFKSLYINIY